MSIELATTKHSYAEMKSLLYIDKNRLDEMLQQQAQLYSDVSDSYAQAASFRDRAKQTLEQLDAHLANDFRTNAIDKVTEAKIQEYVQMHPDHKQQVDVHLAYKLMTDEWGGLVNAFEQRVEAIRHLVGLERQGYFGTGLVKDNEYSEALSASAEARKARASTP